MSNAFQPHGSRQHRVSTHQRQRGQSMMEYAVVCCALAFILFVPIQDDPASPGKARTTVQIVLDGLQAAYRNFSHALSLPT